MAKNILQEGGETIDVTTGQTLGGLRGLQGIRGISRQQAAEQRAAQQAVGQMKREAYEADLSETLDGLPDLRRMGVTEVQRAFEPVPVSEVGTTEFGRSRYDRFATGQEDIRNLDNLRGVYQSTANQVLSGIAKGSVLAGTTFASGTAGLAMGMLNMAAKGEGSAFWDNPLDNWLHDIQEWSERAMPNYRTDIEKNSPWYSNIFSANFIADDVLKNLGFVAGAAPAGSLVTGAIKTAMKKNARNIFKGAVNKAGKDLSSLGDIEKAIRRGEAYIDGKQLGIELAKEAKNLKQADAWLQLTGSAVASVGEAKIEAINNSGEWFDLQKQHVDDYRGELVAKESERLMNEFPEYATYEPTYNEFGERTGLQKTLTPEGKRIVEQTVNQNFNYEGGIERLAEDRAKVGNVIFGMNMPLLMASNIWQFGKLWGGGFNTGAKANNMIKRIATETGQSYEAIKPSALRTAGRLATHAIAEGPVEEMGQATASLMSGYKYAADLNGFYGAKIDPESELETINWLKAATKAMGETYGTVEGWKEGAVGSVISTFGVPSIRGIRSSTGNLQRPIYFQSDIFERISETQSEYARNQEIASEINKRIQSPEYLNYYQGGIRHNRFQKEMDDAVENNDNYEFKNAEFNQLINDVNMFERAGRLEDFYDMIEGVGNVSLDNVDAIRQATTNVETGQSVYDSMTDQELVDHIKKQAEQTKGQAENYRKLSSDIQVKYGDIFQGDELEELAWMYANIDNWESRFKDTFKDTQERLRNILGTIEFHQTHPKAYKMLATKKQPSVLAALGISEAMNTESLLSMNPYDLMNAVADSDLQQGFIQIFDDIANSAANKRDGRTIADNLRDLIKLGNARLEFINRAEGYARNPQALRDYLNLQRQRVDDEIANRRVNSLVNDLSKVNNLNDFRDMLSNEEFNDIHDSAIDNILGEDDVDPTLKDIAKKYREFKEYQDSVDREIDSLNETNDTKNNVKGLFDFMSRQSDDLNVVADPQGVYNFDIDALPDTVTKNAGDQALLEKVLDKVNRSREFLERFKGKYKPIVKDKQGNRIAPGAEQELTSEEISRLEEETDRLDQEQEEEEASDLTAHNAQNDQVVNPNPQVFDNGQKAQTGVRKYYRPVIPQLHIEASKQGDFRPFKIVVKERETGANFDIIYDYLDNEGAFRYINEGNLKVGDELIFIIDPTLNAQSDILKDTILIGKVISTPQGSGYQIVGSIDSNISKVREFEGLEDVRNKVLTEYKNNPTTEEKFVSSITTNVNKIMVGKVPYTNVDIPLNEIQGIQDNPVFGVVRNNKLETGGLVPNDQIVAPQNVHEKNGRLYLMAQSTDGKYRPLALSKRYFNKEQFNPENDEVKNTKRYRDIHRVVSKIVANRHLDNTDQNFRNIVGELRPLLFMNGVHINLHNEGNNPFIVIVKRALDNNGQETPIKIGERTLWVEKSRRVAFQDLPETLFVFGEEDKPTEFKPLVKTNEEITSEIINALLDLNIPLQVDYNRVNTGNYNKDIIADGLLRSNLTTVKETGAWFITDYIDKDGNTQKGMAPEPTKEPIPPRRNPQGSKETVVTGTPVIIDRITYVVGDDGIIYNKEGDMTEVDNEELVRDMASIQKVYGNAQEGSDMFQGKAVMPSGKVLDRNTGEYLSESKGNVVKKAIATRNVRSERILNLTTREVIDRIATDQNRINKVATDDNFYSILEDDGNYHPYRRVSSVIGSNWKDAPGVPEFIERTKNELLEAASRGILIYNNYLNSLGSEVGVNLMHYHGRTDSGSMNTILQMIEDKKNGVRSVRAVRTGRLMDNIIRSFFQAEGEITRPESMTEEAFNGLLETLGNIKQQLDEKGEIFITNNFIVYHKFKNGERIAGEIDILAIDADGNLSVYDIKTSGSPMHEFVNKRGKTVNYFTSVSRMQTRSPQEQYTLQLSGYKSIIESQYNIPVKDLVIVPFIISYTENNISGITKEENIPLEFVNSENFPIERIETPESENMEPENTEDEIMSREFTDEDESGFDEPDDIPLFREITPGMVQYTNETFEREKEWLKRIFPNSSDTRLKTVFNRLVTSSRTGVEVWGEFNNGMMTVSDVGAEGTIYHEAFHAVFNVLLTSNEREYMLNDAKRRFGQLSVSELEEKMAEEFREYVTITEENPSWISRVAAIFRDIYNTMRHWMGLQPSLNYMYATINRGEYSGRDTSYITFRELKQSEGRFDIEAKVTTFEGLTGEVKTALRDTGWTPETFNAMSELEKEHAIQCA